MNDNTCAERYKQLSVERDFYLDRAKDVSKLTLPMVFPEDYFNKSSEIKTPYQSLGARATNNLASKLLLALLPPNTPFFKFSLDESEKANIESEHEGLTTEIAAAMSMLEQRIVTEIESSQLRTAMYQAFIQLIISGNSLLYLEDFENIRVFKLSNYCIQRDAAGEILEIIIKETVAKETLPQNILESMGDALQETAATLTGIPEVDIYTKVRLAAKDKYVSFKEINKMIIPDSYKSYPKKDLPYMSLRFSRVDGESYGRGYAEEYLGDLISLEGLTKSIVEAAAISSKTVFLVNPAATTSAREFAQANNGDVITGRPEDVAPMRVDKSGDYRFAFETMQALQQRLAGVFLLTSSIQRDAERVTAEEIRLMARELEESLGGIYSVLSQEFQLPLINIIIANLTKKKKMIKLPEDLVNISIATGLEALGRGNDLQKLNAFLGNVVQLGEAAFSQINVSNYIERVALSLGLNTQGLIKTPEELQAEQEQAIQNNPEVIKQTGNLMQEEMRNEGRAEQQQGQQGA